MTIKKLQRRKLLIQSFTHIQSKYSWRTITPTTPQKRRHCQEGSERRLRGK